MNPLPIQLDKETEIENFGLKNLLTREHSLTALCGKNDFTVIYSLISNFRGNSKKGLNKAY